jgi:hypothetical protein
LGVLILVRYVNVRARTYQWSISSGWFVDCILLPMQVGAEIVRRALGYPLKLIANNAGTNGSVVMQKVLDSKDPNIGYNAATDK